MTKYRTISEILQTRTTPAQDDHDRKWLFWNEIETLTFKKMMEVGKHHPDYEYFQVVYKQAFKAMERLYEERHDCSRYN